MSCARQGGSKFFHLQQHSGFFSRQHFSIEVKKLHKQCLLSPPPKNAENQLHTCYPVIELLSSQLNKCDILRRVIVFLLVLSTFSESETQAQLWEGQDQ